MPAILPVLFAVATRKNKAPRTEPTYQPRPIDEPHALRLSQKILMAVVLTLMIVLTIASAAVIVVDLFG